MTDTNTAQTGADIVAAAYPARYYAQYDRTAAGITLVTGIVDTQAHDAKINALPAAADMVPLTREQYDNAGNATNIQVSNGALLYPDRYYARYDHTAEQPTGVTGWFDTWSLSDTSFLPRAADMVALSASDWSSTSRNSGGKGVQDGKIIDYTPPVPLAERAGSELIWVTTQATMAAAMGETFTPEMKAYVQAIKAIADGTDTASTKLPDRPTNIMS